MNFFLRKKSKKLPPESSTDRLPPRPQQSCMPPTSPSPTSTPPYPEVEPPLEVDLPSQHHPFCVRSHAMYSGHRQRKSPQRYAPQQYNNAGNLSPGTMSNRMTIRNMQRALESPRGIAMMQTLGLSPTPVSPPPNGQRVRRSLEDIVTKAVAPGDPGLTDLVLTEHISSHCSPNSQRSSGSMPR